MGISDVRHHLFQWESDGGQRLPGKTAKVLHVQIKEQVLPGILRQGQEHAADVHGNEGPERVSREVYAEWQGKGSRKRPAEQEIRSQQPKC